MWKVEGLLSVRDGIILDKSKFHEIINFQKHIDRYSRSVFLVQNNNNRMMII